MSFFARCFGLYSTRTSGVFLFFFFFFFFVQTKWSSVRGRSQRRQQQLSRWRRPRRSTPTRYRTLHATPASQATKLLSWKPCRTRGNLSHRSAQQSPGPRLNPERQQRGDVSHHQPLRCAAEVVRSGG